MTLNPTTRLIAAIALPALLFVICYTWASNEVASQLFGNTFADPADYSPFSMDITGHVWIFFVAATAIAE